MPRYNRYGARLVNRELRVRPTRARAEAMDALDARYRKQQARHDQLEDADWRLRRQLRDIETEIQAVSRARHPGERRKLVKQRDELRASLAQGQGEQRKLKRDMEETRAEAAGHHAVVQALAMACPSCDEETTPDGVIKVRAWTSFKRAGYTCQECGHEWTART